MKATRDEINQWIDEGRVKGATHLLVVCDTFSLEDYPIYVKPDEDLIKIRNHYDQKMRRVVRTIKL